MLREKLKWLTIYEFTWIVVTILLGLYRLGHHLYPRTVQSINFIKECNPVYAVFSITSSNASSFFMASSLIVLNPILGVLVVIYMSFFSSTLIALYLIGACPIVHFYYSIIECQVYLALWAYTISLYYIRKKCKTLLEAWRIMTCTLRRLIPIALLTFTILAIVEVWEVLTYA